MKLLDEDLGDDMHGCDCEILSTMNALIHADYAINHPVDVALEYAIVAGLACPDSAVSWTLWVPEHAQRPAGSSVRVLTTVPAAMTQFALGNARRKGGASCPVGGS